MGCGPAGYLGALGHGGFAEDNQLDSADQLFDVLFAAIRKESPLRREGELKGNYFVGLIHSAQLASRAEVLDEIGDLDNDFKILCQGQSRRRRLWRIPLASRIAVLLPRGPRVPLKSRLTEGKPFLPNGPRQVIAPSANRPRPCSVRNRGYWSDFTTGSVRTGFCFAWTRPARSERAFRRTRRW